MADEPQTAEQPPVAATLNADPAAQAAAERADQELRILQIAREAGVVIPPDADVLEWAASHIADLNGQSVVLQDPPAEIPAVDPPPAQEPATVPAPEQPAAQTAPAITPERELEILRAALAAGVSIPDGTDIAAWAQEHVAERLGGGITILPSAAPEPQRTSSATQRAIVANRTAINRMAPSSPARPPSEQGAEDLNLIPNDEFRKEFMQEVAQPGNARLLKQGLTEQTKRYVETGQFADGRHGPTHDIPGDVFESQRATA